MSHEAEPAENAWANTPTMGDEELTPEDEAGEVILEGTVVPMPATALMRAEEVSLAPQSGGVPAPAPDSLDAEEAQWGRIARFAEFAATTGLYGDQSAEELAMKALVGTTLGLDIATSFHALQKIRNGINIPAEVQRALARRWGYRVQEVELTDQKCILRLVVEKSGEVVGESTFTWADAQKAKLLGNEVWGKYPRRMLKARCTTDLVSDFCPEILYFKAPGT